MYIHNYIQYILQKFRILGHDNTLHALLISYMYTHTYISMLNKNNLAVKKARGQSEATNISDQKL